MSYEQAARTFEGLSTRIGRVTYCVSGSSQDDIEVAERFGWRLVKIFRRNGRRYISFVRN